MRILSSSQNRPWAILSNLCSTRKKSRGQISSTILILRSARHLPKFTSQGKEKLTEMSRNTAKKCWNKCLMRGRILFRNSTIKVFLGTNLKEMSIVLNTLGSITLNRLKKAWSLPRWSKFTQFTSITQLCY